MIGSCQTHHPFSSAPEKMLFRFVSHSTSLRNRLLLFAISQANELQVEINKVSRKSKENVSSSLFPETSCSKLEIHFPERLPVNLYHDSTIFLELASRYNLLGDNEQIESLSKSMISSFIRMDELAFSTDVRSKIKYKTVLEQDYQALASHLSIKTTQDFHHAPALECCFLANLEIVQTLRKKYRPRLPTLIIDLHKALKKKYEVVFGIKSWWEKNEEEDHTDDDDDPYYY